MKKVLVFGITDTKGGVESVIMNYYRNINRDEIQFDFLCNNEQVAYEDEITALGGTIYRVTARSKNVNQYKKDMIDFFTNHAKEYESIWVNICSLANIDYLKYAKKYGIRKRIIHCHNSQNMDSFLRGLLHRFNKVFLKNYATDFWSCSNDASKWFYSNSMINSDKYQVIKNAIDVDNFEFNEQIRKEYRAKLNLDNKLVIGNVGRFHFQKNHPFIIKVFNEIHKQKPESILLLIGTGPDEDKIKQMVNDFGLKDNVQFLGSRSDVPQLMMAMDGFLFPSVFEGLGIVAVEAESTGLKVFASSKVIPDDVNVDKNLYYAISLDESEKVWCDKILEELSKEYNRKSNIELIKNAGYDIKEEAVKLEKMLVN